jgi:hypothetical protein
MILSASGPNGCELELPRAPLVSGGINPDLMDRIIGPLLDNGELDKAEKICQQFKYTSNDLLLLKTAVSLTSENFHTNNVPAAVVTILESRLGSHSSYDRLKKQDILELIHTICTNGKGIVQS